VRRFVVLQVLSLSLFFLWVSAAWAKEPVTPQMTLQQAVGRALAINSALRLAEYDIDRAYEVRQFAADKVRYIPTGPATPEAEAAFNTLLQVDMGWQMAQKSYTAQEDTVVMAVYQAYNGVLGAREKVNSAQIAVESAEWQKKLAVAGNRAGTVSNMTMVQADAALSGGRAALDAACQSLDDAYQKFNQLVGLWPEDRPVLTDQPVYSPLTIDNLDTEVERAIEANPAVWLAGRKIDLAEISLNLYNFTDPNRIEPYQARKIDVDKALVSASDIQEQARKLVRSLYYAARQMEGQYTGVLEQVKIAEEALRVTRLKYDLGMATRAEVVRAEASLANARQSLVDITCQHEILKMAFRKPWAYAAAGSSF